MKKVLSLLMVLAMVAASCFALTSCGKKGEEAGDADLKLGFIFLHDENSTYDKNFMDAAREVQKELNLTDEQVIFKTNVPEGNECYEAAADLADQGCNIVFADSFGHEPYMLKAAKEFPEVQFCHATGTTAHTENLANFHNAFTRIYEARYVGGIVAGMKLQQLIDEGKIQDKNIDADGNQVVEAEVPMGQEADVRVVAREHDRGDVRAVRCDHEEGHEGDTQGVGGCPAAYRFLCEDSLRNE